MKQSSPILKGDHPELDDLEFISEEDKVKYMSMISTAFNQALYLKEITQN